MLDVEKFLVALRSNKDLDGKLNPIHLADTVQEEIKIIQAAVENSRREWVGLTYEEIQIVASKKWWNWEDEFDIEGFSRAIERVLKEKNHG